MCASFTETQTSIEYTATVLSPDSQCSVCHSIFDRSLNRIIIEACGHRKCRECLIKEVDGCALCAAAPAPAALPQRACETKVIEGPADRVVDATASEGLDNEAVSNVIEFNGGYKCTICQRCFKSRNNRKYHQFCNSSQAKPFKCDRCDRQFITLAHLKYHQSAHDGDQKFPCLHCGKVYTREVILRKHMRKHQNDRRYKCGECNETFVYKQQLNIHRNKHKNIYHKCSECDKRFLIKSNYRKHVQIHSGENRRKCSICQNSFSGSSALKTHMLTHSTSRAFQCTKCQKSFIDQRTLDRHSKIHIERHYECTMCPARSGRKDNIRRHVRNLHSTTDDQMHAILRQIFANFTRKHEPRPASTLAEPPTNKTDNEDSDSFTVDDPMESAESSPLHRSDHAAASNVPNKEPTGDVAGQIDGVQPKNIVTSVIRFAGRAPSSLIAHATTNKGQIEEPPPTQDVAQRRLSTVEGSVPTQKPADGSAPPLRHGPQENDLDLAPLSYKPLNYEPLPELAPLPLLNTNNNLSVYRQLLSPYLRKPATVTRAADTANRPKQASVIIDRPPKKMIGKYASLAKP